MLALFVPLALALAPPLAPAHRAPWPTLHEDAAALRADWTQDGEALRSPTRAFDGGGVRVGAIAVSPTPVTLVARGLDGGRVGPWVEATQTWTNGMERVLVADLGEAWPEAQVRLSEHAALRDLAWELLHPVNEPRAEGPPLERPPSVSANLQAIGVIPREQWGATATGCSTLEDDWYRMAIHHTAGVQTSSGSVQGAVQALQAYAMGSGSYCDIPYQFLVGYDGSLWEGRALTLRSGATGGDNNTGNIAVCFLGCYHPSSCPTSHAATDAMMDWAGLLTRTLAAEHGVEMNSDAIRGHRDWPDNSTACPGEWVYERLDELRQPAPPYAATWVSTELPVDGAGTLEVVAGEATGGWVTLRNTGHRAWDSSTRLAPTPRDVASPLAGDDWISETRISSPEATVQPGDEGRLWLSVGALEPGSYRLEMTLVQEWVSWFGDLPLGGQTGDAAFTLDIVAVEGPQDSPSADDSAVTADSGPSADGGGRRPGVAKPMSALGCASGGPRPAGWLLGLFGLALGLRRRG